MATAPANESLGDDLIFLLSQRRAGSTMLQRILASHPAVHTVSEPWVLLPPFLALRPDGYGGELFWGGRQSAGLLKKALGTFVAELPGREDTYREGVRRMYGHLYRGALERSGKRLLLDKSPPYYYIIPEVRRTFPRAKFLFLLRNPLAVLGSVLDTWVWNDLFALREFRDDLLAAPGLLVEGLRSLEGDCLVVRYERLVAEPAAVLEDVCRWLGIDFLPEMVEYGRHPLPRFALGDPENVYRHSRPESGRAGRWQGEIGDPQRWRLTRDYLRWLGPETVGALGYSYAELEAVVEQRRPGGYRFLPTLSLACCLGEPSRLQRLLGFAVRCQRACRRDGVRRVLGRAVRRLAAAVRPRPAGAPAGCSSGKTEGG
jgi:hypothetical protein